jgi:CheY-like chemotaxis protein
MCVWQAIDRHGKTIRAGRLASGMLLFRGMIKFLRAVSKEPEEEPVSNVVNPELSDPFRGTKTVVLAEDEAVVREFMACVLREMGCIVLEAENGQQALRLFEDPNGPTIDLLLTDLVMPVLGGKALAHKVESLFPGTKIVFCSAYLEKVGVINGMFDTRIPFLQKPTTIDALKQKVLEILGDAEEDLQPAGLTESPCETEMES